MKNVVPYIIFNGNCKEAMEFYQSHLGGEMMMMTYGQAEQKGGCPEGAENKIIHANIIKGNFTLLASDTPHQAAKIGDNVQLYLSCDSREEVDRIFKAFGNGGKEIVQLADTFWGAYFGMVIDKYNTHWMISFELPKK